MIDEDSRRSWKYMDYEDYATAAFRVGAVLGLLTVLVVLITPLTFRSLGILIALAVVAVLIIMAIVFRLLVSAYNRAERKRLPSKKEKEEFASANIRRMRNEFVPGMRFWAWGSMGQQLEGEFIRWIDRDTMEAIVWDPRGGPREKGPFPLKEVLGPKT